MNEPLSGGSRAALPPYRRASSVRPGPPERVLARPTRQLPGKASRDPLVGLGHCGPPGRPSSGRSQPGRRQELHRAAAEETGGQALEHRVVVADTADDALASEVEAMAADEARGERGEAVVELREAHNLFASVGAAP
jgi:hypothetical protein